MGYRVSYTDHRGPGYFLNEQKPRQQFAKSDKTSPSSVIRKLVVPLTWRVRLTICRCFFLHHRSGRDQVKSCHYDSVWSIVVYTIRTYEYFEMFNPEKVPIFIVVLAFRVFMTMEIQDVPVLVVSTWPSSYVSSSRWTVLTATLVKCLCLNRPLNTNG